MNLKDFFNGMKSIRRSFLAVVGMLAVCSAAQAEQITFQVLSASSARSDVQAHFPNTRGGRADVCIYPDVQSIKIGRAFIDCDTLEAPDIDVLGMKFDGSFTFDGMTHKLLFVDLVHRWADPAEAGNPNRLDKSAILAQYRQLRTNLISIRGMPRRERFSCVTEDSRRYYACDTWQGAPGDLPDNGLGTIELGVSAQKENENDPTYGGNFYISYALTAATLTNDMPVFPASKRARQER